MCRYPQNINYEVCKKSFYLLFYLLIFNLFGIFNGLSFSQEKQPVKLTINDVIEGLKVFESQFQEIKCSYTVYSERTDLSFKMYPALGKGKLPPLSFDVAWDISGNISRKTYQIKDNERRLEYKIVSDGEKGASVQYLNPNHGYSATGTFNAYINREDALPIYDAPLYSILASARGVLSLSEFVKKGSPQGKFTDSKIISMEKLGNDIICVIEVNIEEGNIKRNTS